MKIGYSLSGGGARGIAHLGILKALDENNIHPDLIAGVSAGSIIGAFYASGHSPEEILKIISDARLIKIIRPAFTLNGLLSLEKSFEFFLKYFREDSFEKLRFPLYINAVNIKTGKSTYFSSGKLIRPVLASSAIPVVFDPIEINGEYYIDGGVLDNLPVEPLVGRCDRIIGFHCNPVDHEFNSKNIRKIIERTFILAINMNVVMKRSLCDIFLEPEKLNKFGAFDFEKADEIFRIGYEYAKNRMPEMLKIL